MTKWIADVAAIAVGVVIAELLIRLIHGQGLFPDLQ